KTSRTGFSTPLGQRIIPIDSIDSTNDYIIQYPFLPSGTIVIARSQRKGKGQKDRKWISNVGGLYFSFKLVFPQETNISQSKVFWIQSALSISICKALKNTGLNPTLKWPNDIMVFGKKIGGILGESKIGNQGMVIFLGLGLNIENNLNEIITEFPELNGKISSVKKELILLGKQPSEENLIINTFQETIFYMDTYWNSNFPLDVLKNEWLSFSNIINKSIKFKDLEKHFFEATVNDITDYGSLLVTTSNKEKKELTVGEIEFLEKN
ncbi:MAG: putative biotin ligase, partial [Candidatus Heimdallarchaeota archaeon LC_3]